MIEILNTLVSLDLFKEFFCCDLDKCHGLCCVEGDAGAPVTPDEVEMLEEAYEKLHEDLPLQAQQQIEKEGVVYPVGKTVSLPSMRVPVPFAPLIPPIATANFTGRNPYPALSTPSVSPPLAA